jgi:hypothetical protein
MPGSEVRWPSPLSPPEPPRTRSEGLGPRILSSCARLLVCSLARAGSVVGAGDVFGVVPVLHISVYGEPDEGDVLVQAVSGQIGKICRRLSVSVVW